MTSISNYKEKHNKTVSADMKNNNKTNLGNDCSPTRTNTSRHMRNHTTDNENYNNIIRNNDTKKINNIKYLCKNLGDLTVTNKNKNIKSQWDKENTNANIADLCIDLGKIKLTQSHINIQSNYSVNETRKTPDEWVCDTSGNTVENQNEREIFNINTKHSSVVIIGNDLYNDHNIDYIYPLFKKRHSKWTKWELCRI
jgi:hypothetical protein